MVFAVLALLPATWVRLSTEGKHSEPGEAPVAPVAVVFGAGLWDEEPSPHLAQRLDTAAQLYTAGRVRALLVTGDNSREEYDEPGAMRRYLLGRGVPADRIVADHAGFDTWDSCTRAKRIFGVDRALVVSQGFHVPRAVALCRAAGVDAHGVRAAEPPGGGRYVDRARELAAAVKAGFEAALTPDPRFLGPREQGVSRALRD
ncbi:YdcF family protein [Streptomyces sp. P38-E01]|uniref:YdcF family protein n=2 Tax=Streptomyces tardus TaxID=2780544 RepID=A0A949JI73_9ACTN|nr:YdcF family protein [Streptomyces tardus]